MLSGALAGAVAAVVGAALWAVITVLAEYQIGWMAIGVGVLVGVAVRKFGKGLDNIFGAVGAALALLGCVSGNLLAACGFLAKQESASFLDVLSILDLDVAIDLLDATFSPMDLLFYGLAIYEGYKLSIRRVSQQELMDKFGGPAATLTG